MMRKLLVALLALLLLTIGAQAQEQNNEELALQIVAQINDWRISEGVAPLKPNPTLDAMALDQASYVVSLDKLPDDFHAGRTGLHPQQRALADPFDWPHYQLAAQIAIGENAALGSVNSAMTFWHNSDIHRRTALNPAYREIGVAALPYGRQTFFIVDFGSRPNVLPALADPTSDRTIYLTNEQFQYAKFYNSIHTVTDIQLFDSAGRPLSDKPVAWADKITVPADAGDTVYILSSDGEHEVLSAVNFATDRVILPGFMPTPEAPPATSTPTATPTLRPTATRAVVGPTQTPTQIVPTSTPQPTATPTATEPPVDMPEIRILYTRDTLDVVNISGGVSDWTGLELVGAITFPFSQFTRVTDFPLNALPANHCLQIRDVTLSGNVVVPSGCRWVRSLITVLPDRIFWTKAPFDVRRNGVTLATCQPNADVCDVNLP